MKFSRVLIGSLILCGILGSFGSQPTFANSSDLHSYERRWGSIDISERPLTGRPRVALALSGGSARGLAHIGVLQAFQGTDIEIAGIAGSSMGGIIGGLYSVGHSTDEIVKIAEQINFSTLFANSPRRKSLFLTQREKMDRTLLTLRFNSLKPSLPTELSAAQGVTELFTSLTLEENFRVGRDFTRLSPPFKTVATDISTGEAVTLDHGSLAEAMRATMAFPLAISAVAWGDRLLMDGGMIKPVPVDLAKEFLDSQPGSYTVAVNATTELLAGELIDNPFAVAVQVTSIMSMRELDEQLALADFVITPDYNSLSGSDFKDVSELISAGRIKAEPIVTEILAKERRRKAERPISFDTLVLQGDISAIKNLITKIESLCSSQGDSQSDSSGDSNGAIRAISEAKLDSLLAKRYQRGDLWLLTAELVSAEVSPDSLNPSLTTQPARLEIQAVVAPSPSELRFMSPTESARQSKLTPQLHEYLSSQYAASGIVSFDSLAIWTDLFYDSAGIELIVLRELSYDPASKSLGIVVNEGIAVGLAVQGLNRTRLSYIRDRVRLEPGRPFSVAKTKATYRDLFGSGLFKRVALDATPIDSGVILTVRVEEDNSVKLRFGYHYHDEYHNEGLLEVAEDNLFGIGLHLGASGILAERHKRVQTEISTNRFFRTFVAAELQAYYDEIEPRMFSGSGEQLGIGRERRRGALFKLGQHISRFGFVSAALRIEDVNEMVFNSPLENRYELRSFELHSEVDDLDRTHFPRKGRHSEFTLETFGKVFGGETEFTRWQISFSEYLNITRRFNLNGRAFIAGSRSNLPSPEQFRLGGIDSFEGLHFEELRGPKAALFNLAARWEALPNVYLSAKYNAGNVYNQTDDISSDNLLHGWAATVGWDTPFGPIIFSYGEASENRSRAHFHAGLRF